MLMFESVRRCDFDSADEGGRAGASTFESVSSAVGCASGDATGESENLAADLLDQVLKCAGGGRLPRTEPVGRTGRFERRSCR